MSTDLPFLSVSHMQLWLSRQATSPIMAHLADESSHEYLMRWAAFHHIRLNFHIEDYSANTTLDPIVCVPIGRHCPQHCAIIDCSNNAVGGVQLRCSSGNGADTAAAREVACKRFVDTYGCVSNLLLIDIL